MCERDNSIETLNLGTKEYWKHFYATEYENFQDHGETGEIWFGKENVNRILQWLLKNNIDKHSLILDVGCGNGLTLLTLAQAGYHRLVGIDYINSAVELAENIAKLNKVDIKFEAADILQNAFELPETSVMNNTYDVVIDKGTYDAIGLCPDNGLEKRIQYSNKIQSILSSQGFFIIVSCNWTKDELLSNFLEFYLHDEISIPTFCFGGKSGQTVTFLILKKNNVKI